MPTRPSALALLIPALTLFALILERERLFDILAGSWIAAAGALAGIGSGGILMAMGNNVLLRPRYFLPLTLGGAALYTLFSALLRQMGALALPPYLPAAWIEALCQAGIGVIIGACLPFLLFTLVSALFRLLDGASEER